MPLQNHPWSTSNAPKPVTNTHTHRQSGAQFSEGAPSVVLFSRNVYTFLTHSLSAAKRTKTHKTLHLSRLDIVIEPVDKL